MSKIGKLVIAISLVVVVLLLGIYISSRQTSVLGPEHIPLVLKPIAIVSNNQQKLREGCNNTCSESKNNYTLSKKITTFNDMLKLFNERRSNNVRTFDFVQLLKLPVEGEEKLLRDEIYKAIIYKKWDVVLEKIPLAQNDIQEIALSSAILKALMSNSQIDVFINLFSLGAKLPQDAIHVLSSLGHVQLANELLEYGLDLYFRDSAGMNAIEYLVFRQSGNRFNREMGVMILFLLTNNISLSAYNNNLDALNFSLMKLGSNDNGPAVNFSRLLLDVGANIGETHRQQMKELKSLHLNKYLEVVKILPQLAIEF